MKERPILFSAPMVRAILDGRKTVTRRVAGRAHPRNVAGFNLSYCPFHVGSILWVRETFALAPACDDPEPDYEDDWHVIFRADDDGQKWRDADGNDVAPPWKPSIHMPRWASRVTLEVTSVRIERLQDITEEDARAEGVEPAPFCKAGRPNGMEHVEAFEQLWCDINGPESWNANPWVWVVAFRRVEQQA